MDAVYRAISDPTRRTILGLLALSERPVTELARHVAISQPGLSQHLRILREAGLVRVRREGRRRIYSIRTDPLRPVVDWAVHLGAPGPGVR